MIASSSEVPGWSKMTLCVEGQIVRIWFDIAQVVYLVLEKEKDPKDGRGGLYSAEPIARLQN